MRELILEELSLGAPPERVAQARQLIRRSGNFAAALIELGFAPRDVLQACCAATGLPPAPLTWTRDPHPPAVDGLDSAACRKWNVAPLAQQGGRLCVGYADPEVAVRAETLPLPRHQAYLALPADVARAIQAIPLRDREPSTVVNPPQRARKEAPRPTDDDDALFDDEAATRQVGSVPIPEDDVDDSIDHAADDDGATVVSAPVQFHEDDDVDASEADDAPAALPDDKTAALSDRMSPLPNAPKPERRQQSGAVSELGLEGIPAPARSRASPVPSQPDADVVTAPSVRRAGPSLATLRHGLSRAAAPEHRSLRSESEPALPEMPQPAETVITKGPPVEVPPPAPRPPPRASSSPPPPPPARKAVEPPPTIAAAPTGVTLSDEPASMNTQQQAIALLSGDDLLDDDEGGTPRVVSTEPPQAPPTPHDTTKYTTPAAKKVSDDGAGAFASAETAQDKEAVQQQKQRLKRIAQIASVKRYKIERVLGRGGMATVYYATDTKTGAPCALKLMEPHLADDAVFVERFKREIRASISLNHENIVRVFDYGEENGTYYMASEYVDGGTVASLLKELDRPLPLGVVLPVMMGFLDGLQHAHEQGFVHRDLKPANLMLTKAGVIKIGDFGIAKAQTDSTLTKTGALFGTPAYMSPEQAQGQELDARSDLFGVGIIFYELLAGYNPFAHENPSTTMFAIAKGQARALFDANPTVPEAVDRVVTRLLERDKNKRYQSAGEALSELRPMFDLVRAKHPQAVARTLADSHAVVDELGAEQAALESSRAQQLLQRTPPEHAEACFRFYKATLLDPRNVDAVNGLTQLRADYGFRFTRPDDKQILELEQALEKKADQPAVLRRLADLSATHRNLVDMAGFMKRYLRLMPGDTHVLHKLERIIGTDPLAPYSVLAAPDASRTAAWSANEEMVDTARAAAEEPSDPGRGGVRPAARVRAAATPGGRAPTPPTPPPGKRDTGPTPTPAAPAESPSSSAPNRRPAAAAAKDAGPTLPEANAPEPKDSLEALLRIVRHLLEDTVRSLTGDQGVAAVKEALAERFGDGRGELTDIVKGALGKGKDAVAESLLKKEGREQLKTTVRSGVQKHWRLALVVLGIWLVLIALGKACSYACSGDDVEEQKPPPKLEPRTAGLDDDGSTKPAPPEPAAVVDAGPAIDASKYLEDKKPEAPPPPDSKAELKARQDELKKRARAEPDKAKAIDLYTEAFDTDPYSESARGAILERAKLHMALGHIDDAENDLFRLKRRPDYDQVSGEVEPMLDEIKKARKKAEPPPPPPE